MCSPGYNALLASDSIQEHIGFMTVSARRMALAAVSTVLAACSVETGKVVVGVDCAGAGCGQSGVLYSRIEDCDEDTAFYGDQSVVVSALDSSASYAFGFENVEEGTRCVQVFLDTDTSGNLSTGDVISSVAVHQGVGEVRDDEEQDLDDDAEIDVEVEDDDTVVLDVTLDTIVDAEL